MSCLQANYSITVPQPADRTDHISFETQSSITVTFVLESGYTFLENAISCTASVNPLPSGVTPPSISQTNHTITFYDPNDASVDYDVEVATDEEESKRIGEETPTSKITFKPRTNCS